MRACMRAARMYIHALSQAEQAMTPMEFSSFKAHVAMLLRGTTADLTDVTVAYWNGSQVVVAYLRDNGRMDEEFDFDENAWGTGATNS